MLEITRSVELGSSADAVWATIGNFNGLPDWHPWVRGSVLEPVAGGVGRRVTIEGGRTGRRELAERLLFFDGAGREYAYTIVAGPVTFAEYEGRCRVIPTGQGRCRVEYRARYKPASGSSEEAATERISTFYDAAFRHRPTIFGT
jgi:hypothetical protein